MLMRQNEYLWSKGLKKLYKVFWWQLMYLPMMHVGICFPRCWQMLCNSCQKKKTCHGFLKLFLCCPITAHTSSLYFFSVESFKKTFWEREQQAYCKQFVLFPHCFQCCWLLIHFFSFCFFYKSHIPRFFFAIDLTLKDFYSSGFFFFCTRIFHTWLCLICQVWKTYQWILIYFPLL